ncbi:MAG TPA: hypothetical protein VF072_08660 [Thermoleophilaceae bacterium]
MSSGLGTAHPPSAGAAASNLARFAPPAAAGAGVVMAVARFGADSHALVAAVLLGALGFLAVVDVQRRVIPMTVVLPSAALVLILQLLLFPEDALEWVLAALITGGALLVLSLVKRDSVERGDAAVGLLIGAGLGTEAALAMLVGCLLLWPVAGYVVLKGGADARKMAIPLTPALALGTAIVLLAG